MKDLHPTIPCRQGPAGRRAFTLIELVMSMVIVSVIFGAMVSAVLIASKALPNANDPLVQSLQGSQAIDQIAREAESALYISQLSPTSIAFTVADRDGDGLPERISYSWSGVAGDPLLRSYNNGAAIAVVDSVSSFNLSPNVQYVSETYPGAAVEDALPSLLQDCTAASNTTAQSLGSTNATNFGQYFAPTFTPDVVGWRPTSVTLKAMRNKTPGTFRVQMRPASTGLLLPTTTILSDQVVDSLTLTTSMATYTYNLSGLPRISPGDAVCLAVMWDSGPGPAKVESNSTDVGMLKTSSLPTSWSYVSNNCLSTQLYGVLLRPGATQTATTQYLLTLGISLRTGASTNAMAQTSALALNHPELVANLWELKFDRDPTTIDTNGDGQKDWALAGGGAFNTNSLSSSGWTTTTDTLLSGPGNDFNGVVIVDLRMQSRTAGAAANFAINAFRSGSQCVPLTAALFLEADGTQTLKISQKLSDASSTQLISFNSVPAGPADVHLVLDPAVMGVAVMINGVQRGTFPLSLVAVSDSTRACALSASGGSASFSYARVRILKAAS